MAVYMFYKATVSNYSAAQPPSFVSTPSLLRHPLLPDHWWGTFDCEGNPAAINANSASNNQADCDGMLLRLATRPSAGHSAFTAARTSRCLAYIRPGGARLLHSHQRPLHIAMSQAQPPSPTPGDAVSKDLVADNVKFYDQFAATYDDQPGFPEFTRMHVARLRELYPFDPSTTTVLDFACGTGGLSLTRLIGVAAADAGRAPWQGACRSSSLTTRRRSWASTSAPT